MKKQTIFAVLAITPTLGMFALAAFSQDKSRDLIKPPEVSIQVNTVAFSPDNRLLAAGCTRRPRSWAACRSHSCPRSIATSLRS